VHYFLLYSAKCLFVPFKLYQKPDENLRPVYYILLY